MWTVIMMRAHLDDLVYTQETESGAFNKMDALLELHALNQWDHCLFDEVNGVILIDAGSWYAEPNVTVRTKRRFSHIDSSGMHQYEKVIC